MSVFIFIDILLLHILLKVQRGLTFFSHLPYIYKNVMPIEGMFGRSILNSKLIQK